MAVPVYQSKSSTGEQYLTNFVPSLPTGTTDGDLLIACCWGNAGAIDTAPAGWTQALAIDNGSVYLNVYTKTAGASESAPTFSNASGVFGEVVLYRLTGHNSSSPVDATDTASGTLDAPSVPTTVDDCFVLHLFGSGSGSGSSITAPTGDTQLDDNQGMYVTAASGYTSQATAGATGAATFDDGAMTFDQVTATLAIAPPAAGGAGGPVPPQPATHYWAATQPAASGPVGTLTDEVGNADLTAISGTATKITRTGWAAYPSGSPAVNMDFATFQGTGSHTGSAYTLCGWARYTGTTDNSAYVLLRGTLDINAIRHEVIGTTIRLRAGGMDRIQIAKDGDWHFFAMSRDGTDCTVWLDDQSNSFTYGGQPETHPQIKVADIDGGSTDSIDVDDLGYWDYALTADEIDWIYNSGDGRSLSTIQEPYAFADAGTLQFDVSDPVETPALLASVGTLQFDATDAVAMQVLLASAGTLQFDASDQIENLLASVGTLQFGTSDPVEVPGLLASVGTLQFGTSDPLRGPNDLADAGTLQFGASDAVELPVLLASVETLQFVGTDAVENQFDSAGTLQFEASAAIAVPALLAPAGTLRFRRADRLIVNPSTDLASSVFLTDWRVYRASMTEFSRVDQ